MGKNWKAICALKDWFLKVAIAHAEPGSDVEVALKRGFPECFTEGESTGATPWSMLVRDGEESYRADIAAEPYYLAAADTLKKFDIPFGRYAFKEIGAEEFECPILPPETARQCTDFGDVVDMEGAKFVVVDYYPDFGIVVCLAPLERIDMNA